MEPFETTIELPDPGRQILVRRHTLQPGEVLPWHTDRCHRLVITVGGDRLRIEYGDAGEGETEVVEQ